MTRKKRIEKLSEDEKEILDNIELRGPLTPGSTDRLTPIEAKGEIKTLNTLTNDEKEVLEKVNSYDLDQHREELEQIIEEELA